MTIKSSTVLKKELFHIFAEYETKNRFHIFRACSRLKSPQKTMKDAEEASKLFFQLLESIHAKGWNIPFEVFENEGVIYMGKEDSEVQFSFYADENGFGIFVVNKKNSSEIEVIEVSIKDLEPISAVACLLLLVIEARRQSVEKQSLKI